MTLGAIFFILAIILLFIDIIGVANRPADISIAEFNENAHIFAEQGDSLEIENVFQAYIDDYGPNYDDEDEDEDEEPDEIDEYSTGR